MRNPANADAADLARMAERVGDRLRHLPARRLHDIEPEVRVLLDDLAGLARAAEGRAPRPLPRASVAAFGDQLAVLGRDIAAALEAAPSPDLLRRAHDTIGAVRRAAG